MAENIESTGETSSILRDVDDLKAPEDSPYNSVVLEYQGKERGEFGGTLMERATHYFETKHEIPPVSQRFIDCAKGNMRLAKKRWAETLQWRAENKVNGLCRTGQPNFDEIKLHYPQYYHQRSKEGYQVYYELLGKIDLKSMKKTGLVMDDLLQHYIFLTEFLYTYLSPEESSKTITVLDCEHLSMMRMPSDVQHFITTANRLLGDHYPEKAAFIYIINVPIWFKVLFNIISPFLDPATKAKVSIVRGKKAVTKALLKHIEPENLPKCYGGSSPYELGEAPEERLLASLVEELRFRS